MDACKTSQKHRDDSIDMIRFIACRKVAAYPGLGLDCITVTEHDVSDFSCSCASLTAKKEYEAEMEGEMKTVI